MSRLEVIKTGKLWIGGKWPRSESGATFPVCNPQGEVVARCASASRKDSREAVEAARSGLSGWRDATATLRGQVMYRAAEMLEGRAAELAEALQVTGAGAAAARQEVEAAVDRLVMLAGWCDKIHQVLGCQNSVAGPYHCFTIPQPCGVIVAFSPPEPPLLSLVTLVGAAMSVGNAVVAVAPPQAALAAVLFGEVLAVSDVPAGAVNILTGTQKDLVEPLGTHREVAVVVSAGLGKSERMKLRNAAADGIRRVHAVPWTGAAWGDDQETCSPWFLEQFVEFKTLWHPSAT
ncbi:MAG: aldehyde dehydrogenase family protein [Phycisphaerales bacterium]|jgi:acyl-CoA reductase-like NAD-dependent aldehyde dehydrogenase|nr:aldehyde dehydrogenase family protein [Phycisphaerales bacterium]